MSDVTDDVCCDPRGLSSYDLGDVYVSCDSSDVSSDAICDLSDVSTVVARVMSFVTCLSDVLRHDYNDSNELSGDVSGMKSVCLNPQIP